MEQNLPLIFQRALGHQFQQPGEGQSDLFAPQSSGHAVPAVDCQILQRQAGLLCQQLSGQFRSQFQRIGGGGAGIGAGCPVASLEFQQMEEDLQ